MTAQRDEWEAVVEETLSLLRERGVVAHLREPVAIADVLTGQADAYAQACAQRDEALGRLQAVRATCWPLHRNPGPLGEFARTVLAEADPRPETATPAEVTL